MIFGVHPYLSVANMDVVSAVSGYISKMVSAGDSNLGSSSSRMKILLLDTETVRVLEHNF